MRNIWFALVLTLLGASIGCGGTRYASSTMAPVSVSEEYQSDRRDAVLRALERRRYTVESENGTQIIARWEERGRYYRVSIDHGQDISVSFVDSELGAAPAGSAPAQYVRYLNNLRSTIEDELGRPQRDAASAEQQAADLEARRAAEFARRERTILVTSGAAPTRIRAVIQEKLLERSYSVESEDGSVIMARWARGDRFYQLQISYTPDQITLRYVDSDHQDDANQDGVEVVDERYIDYMRRLAGEIGSAVNEG